MELYFVMTILDRERRRLLEKVYKKQNLRLSLTMLGRGTATPEHLSINGLTTTEKAVMGTVADAAAARELLRAAKQKMFIDIPGNGIMLSVPIKSVGGAAALSYLTDNKPMDAQKPAMTFGHELIFVILNEGHSDEVMEAARPAGASGGTVIAAKGTGMMAAEKFLGISLADEKEVILIVAKAENKAAIMRAIIEKAGAQSKAGAICFSLPVSSVAGLRHIEEE